MATYIEDLVQNIYTNCDMSGLDKLNKGLQDAIWYSAELEKNLRDTNQAQKMGFDFHSRAINRSKEAYQIERQKQNLEYQQAKYRLRLNEQEEIIDNRRKRRQDAENKRLSRRNWLMRSAGRILLGYFSIQTLKGIVDTGSRLQLVQKSIEGLTKSTQDWKYVQDQAFRTGTDIEVVAKGYRNFFSSANMAGFGKGQIQGMYGDVLLATRAIGASTQQTEGALLALEQMISKGRVSMEELRRQLGNAIPGAFEIGAKAMNMTTAEFNDFVKTGKLASTVFVPLFIKALKETYADGFKDIEQTVSVAQIRLSNAWKLLTVDIISGETGKAFAEGLNILRETINSQEFKQAIVYLGQLFTLAVKFFSFIIKNLRLILSILGATGLYRLLSRHALLLRVLNMNIGRVLGMLVLMGKHGKFAFAGMSTAAKAFLASLFRILVPLMAIEDLVFFLGEQFLGWNTRSAIGEAVKSANKYNAQRPTEAASLTGMTTHEILNFFKKGTPEYKKVKQAINKNRPEEALEEIRKWSSIRPFEGSPVNYGKQETRETNVSIGDINIKTNSDNPQQVGETVAQALIDLFTSLGITENAKTAIV